MCVYIYMYIYISYHWRKAWKSTPVFLPGESSWTEEEPGRLQFIGHKESDIHVNPNLHIHPNPLPTLTLGVYMFVLYIHVFISILQIR